MSEKEISQKETSEKIMTKYDKKVQRRKEEELKAQKRKKIDRITGIVILAAVVIGLLFIPLRKYIATHSAYITVGGHDITEVEFDYYYHLASSEYINTYGQYLAYMGFNAKGDFASQKYSEDLSWKDFFEQLAVDSIKQNKSLLDAAEAAGFTYDTTKDYEVFAETIKDAAKEAGETKGKYYKMTFGKNATEAALKPFIEEGYLAAAYYKSIAEEKEPAADAIQSYYDENTDTYDSVDYKLIEIAAELPEAEKVTDENGKETEKELDEEVVKVAMEAAKAMADAAMEEILKDGESKTGMLKSAVSAKYRDWLFDAERASGDKTVIEDADNHKYYVLLFEKRYLDETATANIRAIMTKTGNGEDILAEWNAAGATEDAFISMVEKYSEDTYTNTNGGLYEELSKSTLDSTLSDWIFAEDRKAGDTVSIVEEGVTYVMYYVEDGRPEWQVKIAGTLLSEAMNEYLTALQESYEVEDPNGRLVYLKVEAEKEAEESTPETDTETIQTESGAAE